MNLLVRHLEKSKSGWTARSTGGRLDHKHPTDSKFTRTARVFVISIFMISYVILYIFRIGMSQGMHCIFDIVDGVIIILATM